MAKILRMTAEEISREYGAREAQALAMAAAAPEEREDPNPGGQAVATGFAAFQEYLNRPRPSRQSGGLVKKSNAAAGR